jgi:hypothetical protein
LILDQDVVEGHTHLARDAGELACFRFVPQLACQTPKPAGAHQQRRPAFQHELRGVFGHAQVVAAHRNDAVAGFQWLVQLHVIPQYTSSLKGRGLRGCLRGN